MARPPGFLQDGDPFDLAGLVVDAPKPKRAGRLPVQLGEKMLRIVIQPVEFQRQVDLLLIDENRFANGKRRLAFILARDLFNRDFRHAITARFVALPAA